MDKDNLTGSNNIEDIIKLNERLNNLTCLFDNSKDIILFITINGEIVDVNNAAVKAYGYTYLELISKTIFDLRADGTRSPIVDQMMKAMNEGIFFETIHKDRFGNLFPVEVSSVGVNKGSENLLLSIVRDISERKRLEEQMKYMTYHDKLTGLYNRTYFEIERNMISEKCEFPTCIIIADVNGLKLVNDAFGHLQGDKYLIIISDILKESALENSKLFRLGGDEFVIITENQDEMAAKKIIENIKKKCAQYSNLPINPDISLGYSVIRSENDHFDDILNEAENMMYTNKLEESKNFKKSVISSLHVKMKQDTPEINEHCIRVKSMAYDFAKELELSNDRMKKLFLLAEIHDIGKIAVSPEILLKKDLLTEAEATRVKDHCKVGYNIARSLPEIAYVSDLILCHHEKWDGTGYPQGLEGKDIPYLSRVISILDTYDVMINGRNNREGISKSEALFEMKSKSATKFDPELLEKFINMISIDTEV